jgi:hypothetical protein
VLPEICVDYVGFDAKNRTKNQRIADEMDTVGKATSSALLCVLRQSVSELEDVEYFDRELHVN